MGNSSSQTYEKQKSLEERFAEQKQEIQILARKFKGLITKLRNMCSNEERVLREIKSMCAQLKSQLEKTQNLDKDVHELAQDVIAAKTDAQRDYDATYEEQQELEKKLEVLKKNQENAEKKRTRIRIEIENEEKILENLRQEDRRLTENSKEAAKGSIAAGVTAAVLGVVGIFFPPLEVVAIPMMAGAFTVQVGTAAAALIMKNMKTSEEKLQSLRNNISELELQINNLYGEISRHESEIEYKISELENVECNLNEAKRSMDECTTMQINTNLWVSMLNRWLNFLIDITPEAGRVESQLGNSNRAFRQAIEDLITKINSQSIRALEEQSKKLAIE